MERITNKRLVLAAGLSLWFGANATEAAFLLPGSTGTITVTSACIYFGDDCSVNGYGYVTDNGITVEGIGSAIAGDGMVGRMNFVVGPDGNSFTLTSFNMDTYQYTPGGDMATRMIDTSSAGGTISDSGAMTLDLTGRTGIMQFFADAIGEQPWNLDTHAPGGGCAPGSGAYALFTTAESSVVNCYSGAQAFTATGSALTGGGGTWTGRLVSAGNMGSAWWAFDGAVYSEVFNITVTGTPVPIPAGVWLFGSGLLGFLHFGRSRSQHQPASN